MSESCHMECSWGLWEGGEPESGLPVMFLVMRAWSQRQCGFCGSFWCDQSCFWSSFLPCLWPSPAINRKNEVQNKSAKILWNRRSNRGEDVQTKPSNSVINKDSFLMFDLFLWYHNVTCFSLITKPRIEFELWVKLQQLICACESMEAVWRALVSYSLHPGQDVRSWERRTVEGASAHFPPYLCNLKNCASLM